MKKLMLLCFFFIVSGSFYAQNSKSETEPVKKETTKKKSSYNYDKDVKVKSTNKESISKPTATKEAVKKETIKKKSAYDFDKEVPVKSTKKETTARTVSTKKNADANKVDAKTKDQNYTKSSVIKKAPIVKESNEKAPKTPDKVTGEYNGKKVYTGPRGGNYYINKNGNKTYIQD